MLKTIAAAFAALVLIVWTDSSLVAQVFAPKVDYVVGPRPYSLVSADFDNDGDIDLATATWVAFPGSDGKGWVTFLINNGHGAFTVTDTIFIGDALSLAAADLDKNGTVDLVGADFFTNRIYILLNKGEGRFEVADSFASGGVTAHLLCTADLDGDGDIDLAVPNSGSRNLCVFLNHGDGTFPPAILYTLSNFPVAAITGDLDKDGDLDLVVTNNGSGTVSVLLNIGNGTFASGGSYLVGTNPYLPSLADYNKDGILDLAVPNASLNTPFLSLLKGKGDGTF